MVLRELWLDRALLLLLLLILSFQIFSFLNVFVPVSIWWFFVPFALFLPAFIFYAQSVTSDVHQLQKVAFRRAPIAAKIAGVRRAIHGHTHRPATHRHPLPTGGTATRIVLPEWHAAKAAAWFDDGARLQRLALAGHSCDRGAPAANSLSSTSNSAQRPTRD
jgi:UDP-2,3-diacylglucosamine pyrophosphatase LpxH